MLHDLVLNLGSGPSRPCLSCSLLVVGDIHDQSSTLVILVNL